MNDYDGSKENFANEQMQAKNLKQNTVSSGQRQKNQAGKENSGSSLSHGGSKKPKPLASKLENKDKEKDTNLNVDIANGAVPSVPVKDDKVLR